MATLLFGCEDGENLTRTITFHAHQAEEKYLGVLLAIKRCPNCSVEETTEALA
jgi:hypothetical protein